MYSSNPNDYVILKREDYEKNQSQPICEYNPEAEKIQLAYELTRNFTKTWMKHNFI